MFKNLNDKSTLPSSSVTSAFNISSVHSHFPALIHHKTPKRNFNNSPFTISKSSLYFGLISLQVYENCSLLHSMAAIRTTGMVLVREIFRPWASPVSLRPCRALLWTVPTPFRFVSRPISYTSIRCAAASDSGGNKKTSARLSQVQQQLQEAKERAVGCDEPIPKITLDHVIVSFARSGGPGGQNVNKVNTKVDMRFNVKAASWLSDRVKEKIIQTEKNRINKDGELVISSTKTRTQKGNIEDALEKLQAIIDAASYVPPPPSEEQVKKITKLAAVAEQKRLQNKKVLSQKKALRRSRDSYD
ncbi:hypothetical protein QVD17_20154 [Tagetes erecta]|uniref:Prokaryotic-type class I peptide chain release factors domain-containing protein n=1 Tax=Tagetes erecta TaxID=13708 RepID=A0AAD8NXY5_TARER|nr:hypothetical protein QVD17_20154 [Tagetes erecta]